MSSDGPADGGPDDDGGPADGGPAPAAVAVPAADLGWDDVRRGPLNPPDGSAISRVAVVHRGAYELTGPSGVLVGSVDAELRRAARSPADFPAVGDWVVHGLEARDDRRVAITRLLERHSAVVRRAAGAQPVPQIVAANVDVLAVVTTAALLTTGADSDAGHRLERYLVAAAEGSVRPVVVVNKADLGLPDARRAERALRRRVGAGARPVDVVVTSAVAGDGLAQLAALAVDGATLALAGASGVGKSSLVNRLLGRDIVETEAVGAGGRGRHTTVRRELFVMPAGTGTVIDTPGLQDLVPFTDGSTVGLDAVFADVAGPARRCRFADCAHRSEPDCAVRRAVAEGELSQRRLDIYLEMRSDVGAT